MRPRNSRTPLATAVALLLSLGLAPASDAGTKGLFKRGCAKPSGNCSTKDLHGKHYVSMDLTRSRWKGTNLLMASFRFTDLWKANFRGAHLRRADLRNGNRTRANFNKANLQRAKLSHSTFYGTSFRGAKLQKASIIGSNFDNTDLTDANFKNARMKNTSFHGARLCRTIQPNGQPRNDNCNGGIGGTIGGIGGWDCCFPGTDPTVSVPGQQQSNGGEAIFGDL